MGELMKFRVSYDVSIPEEMIASVYGRDDDGSEAWREEAAHSIAARLVDRLLEDEPYLAGVPTVTSDDL